MKPIPWPQDGAGHASRRRGFTLVELLVVVAIIGLLIGLLMPAFAGARTQVKIRRAKAEAQQLVAAWTAYIDDGGSSPGGGYVPMNAGNVNLIAGRYMEINANALDSSGSFVDPWIHDGGTRTPYQVRFGGGGGTTPTRTFTTRAFLYNYNRNRLGNE